MMVRTYGGGNRPISRADSLNDHVPRPSESVCSKKVRRTTCGASHSLPEVRPRTVLRSIPTPAKRTGSYSHGGSLLMICVMECLGSRGERGWGEGDSVPKNCGLSIPATSTLMEFWEMMEHAYEVSFSLDGLRSVS